MKKFNKTKQNKKRGDGRCELCNAPNVFSPVKTEKWKSETKELKRRREKGRNVLGMSENRNTKWKQCIFVRSLGENGGVEWLGIKTHSHISFPFIKTINWPLITTFFSFSSSNPPLFVQLGRDFRSSFFHTKRSKLFSSFVLVQIAESAGVTQTP